MIAIGIGVIASATVVWVWVLGAGTECSDLYGRLPEGTAFHREAKLWPPGSKCVYELPNGRKETRTSFP